jgi:hypothetical protein
MSRCCGVTDRGGGWVLKNHFSPLAVPEISSPKRRPVAAGISGEVIKTRTCLLGPHQRLRRGHGEPFKNFRKGEEGGITLLQKGFPLMVRFPKRPCRARPGGLPNFRRPPDCSIPVTEARSFQHLTPPLRRQGRSLTPFQLRTAILRSYNRNRKRLNTGRCDGDGTLGSWIAGTYVRHRDTRAVGVPVRRHLTGQRR